MDLDKAKKAACILNNIDTLTKEFELFSDYVNFEGELESKNGDTIHFSWNPHAYSGRYVKYIAEGISNEIKKLRADLDRL